VYSIVVNSTGGYSLQAGNTFVGQLWLIISGHVMEKFTILWPILHLWNAKTGE